MNYIDEKSPLSVFWISVGKIDPNPLQPRKEFADDRLDDLAQSIRRYGVLQPLVVTKKESVVDSGDMVVRYELIAGERRLRASKIAGLQSVPAVVRTDITDDTTRLELAIIENLQREDLNPIDRARAFRQLIDDFSVKRNDLAQRMGKSVVYISNSLRLLNLPSGIMQAVIDGKISEGHTRPLLMLSKKPDLQQTLFDEILNRKITVRDAELIARRQAAERAHKKNVDPRMQQVQVAIEGLLETRVHIQQSNNTGGKIVIDFFSDEDLISILEKMRANYTDRGDEQNTNDQSVGADTKKKERATKPPKETENTQDDIAEKDRIHDEREEDDIYSFKNFSL